MKQTEYIWDVSSGVAECRIPYKGIIFTGTAKCHPDDKDFESSFTGCQIAEMRATIKYLTFIKSYEILPAIKALEGFQSTIAQSNQYNPNSYENKMLRRRIQLLKDDLAVTKETIVQLKKNLRDYLEKKEKMFVSVRKIRKEA